MEPLHEVLPKTGVVYSEKGSLVEVLCKPKIMPIKSAVVEKLEKMEADAQEQRDAMQQAEREQEQRSQFPSLVSPARPGAGAGGERKFGDDDEEEDPGPAAW